MKKKVFQQPTTKIVELGVCSMIAASTTPPSEIDPEQGANARHVDYGQATFINDVAWGE